MSFKIKQRVGELLAVVLIVAMVGFLVYMLIPSQTKPPKSSPVTVRSTASFEQQQSHNASKLSYQTPQNSSVLQKSSGVLSTAPQTVANGTKSAAINNNQGNHNGVQNANAGAQQQGNNTFGVDAAAKSSDTACASVPKPVSKADSALLSLPLIGGLVSGITSCGS